MLRRVPLIDYGLRDYGLPPQVWGGEPGHGHIWGDGLVTRAAGYEQGEKARWNHRVNGRGEEQERILAKEPGWTRKDVVQGQFCPCGAWLGSLGLEPTPELFVEHLVSAFREVRRVLRPNGVCWVNLGDSYTGSGKGPTGHNGIGDQGRRQGFTGGRNGGLAGRGGASVTLTRDAPPAIPGYKPKDLLGMPWMVAFALRADGWYLRADIIWSKPNPMPESVTDRPTKAHEYMFLLSKSRTYFYDTDAIREEQTGNAHSRGNGTSLKEAIPGSGIKSNSSFNRAMTQYLDVPGGRNRRSVWEVPTVPFPEAHFATFPPKLVEPMLLAGSRPGNHVLDPFGGACTTALVAARLGRDSTSIDLNPDYLAMGRRRIMADCPMFVEVIG